MSALPVIEQIIENEGRAALNALPAGVGTGETLPVSRLSEGNRRFRVYPPTAGFEIAELIDSVSDFAVAPNIFFTPRFCVPALNRLDERHVRLMTLEDGTPEAPKPRFLMPFTVEKPAFGFGPDIIRAWSNPFGPVGVPIVERREAAQIIDDLFETIARSDVALPRILVFPDMPQSSPVSSLLRSVALANGLPVAMTRDYERPVLDATRDADTYFHEVMSNRHRRNYERLWRQLAGQGRLEYTLARNPEQVRIAMEEFLLLENAGWKGSQRTSLIADRYRGAFAREAVNGLAEKDKCRIHALELDGRVIASLVVLIDGNRAFTWKTTFDETMAKFSPGMLLMMRATENFMDDPNIISADSCSFAEHPMMGRVWDERHVMNSIVIGLNQSLEKAVRRVSTRLEVYRSSRHLVKSLRSRLRELRGVKRR